MVTTNQQSSYSPLEPAIQLYLPKILVSLPQLLDDVDFGFRN